MASHASKPLPNGGKRDRRRGIALIITLVLLALLVLTAVALSSLTKVETSIGSATLRATQARQNALMGLNVAIGQLQRYAGPDKRATARGDTDGGPDDSRYTGVWDPTSGIPGRPLVWLVSGNEGRDNTGAQVVIDPSLATVPGIGTLPNRLDQYNSKNHGAANFYNADAAKDVSKSMDGVVRLVGFDNNQEGGVVVPTVALRATVPGFDDPQPTGRYAYWVSDESIKGPVGLYDRTAQVPEVSSISSLNSANGRAVQVALAQMTATRGGIDTINNFDLDDESYPSPDKDRWSWLPGVLTYQQLYFGVADTDDQRKILRNDFHDLTVSSRGLLVDAADGGLKSNLSYSSLAGISTDLMGYRPFDFGDKAYDPTTTNTAPYHLTINPGSAAAGEPSASIKPVVTEFALEFIPVRNSVGGLDIGVRLVIEFWNPYPLPIRTAASGTADFFVEISGVPFVNFYNTQTTINNYDMAQAIPTNWAIHFGEDIPPGGVLTYELTNTYNTGADLPYDSSPGSTDDNFLNYQNVSNTKLSINLYLPDSANPALPAADPLIELTNIQFDNFVQNNKHNWDDYSVPFPKYRDGSNNYTPLTEYGISFAHRVNSGYAKWSDWVTTATDDLRNPAQDVSTANWEPTGGETNPVYQTANVDEFFSGGDLFHIGIEMPVYDPAAQVVPTSLGALSQMYIPGLRPYAAGNPWGGAANSYFDKDFLLPVSDTWAPGDLFINTRYAYLPSTVGALNNNGLVTDLKNPAVGKSARHLIIDGPFNVNSTSVAGWAAMLGRAIAYQGANGSIENPVFTFPLSAQFLSTNQLTNNDNLGRRTLVTAGAAGTSDDTLRLLATKIVTAIRARAQPFFSIKEFLDSGIVQDAIKQVPAINAGVTQFAPQWVSQASLLYPVLPFLTVRGDTFLIRTYGSAVNPATGEEDAKAYLEAVVQRVPEYVDSSNDPEVLPADAAFSAINGYFGRRFKIVSFRWLSDRDIEDVRN